MALLASQQVTRAGLAPNYAAAAAGGDKVDPGPSTMLHVKNGSAAAVTVTLQVPVTFQGQTVSNVAVNVPAGGERIIGPVGAELFRNPADGKADISYSAAASVTVAALLI